MDSRGTEGKNSDIPSSKVERRKIEINRKFQIKIDNRVDFEISITKSKYPFSGWQAKGRRWGGGGGPLPPGQDVSGQGRGSGLKERNAPENSLPPDAKWGDQPKWASSKSTKTGTWSEGRSFFRTSRSISAEVRAGSREEAIRIRSIRRPMLRRNIPCR